MKCIVLTYTLFLNRAILKKKKGCVLKVYAQLLSLQSVMITNTVIFHSIAKTAENTRLGEEPDLGPNPDFLPGSNFFTSLTLGFHI